MSESLPPPDPRESPFGEPEREELTAPTTVFACGAPSPTAQRLAEAIVIARPGILIVVNCD
jgi:hypothetical protein